jgi:hypothetical protein
MSSSLMTTSEPDLAVSKAGQEEIVPGGASSPSAERLRRTVPLPSIRLTWPSSARPSGRREASWLGKKAMTRNPEVVPSGVSIARE